MTDTAEIAEPLSGDKLYQQRARKALPLLVRQARASTPITYEDLAHELNMPNPRNLNYVLGSIGQTLLNLSKHWNINIPPIQCLVVNKNTRLPGEGVGWFITDLSHYKKLSNKQRRQLVNAELQKIYAFDKWSDVLNTLGLNTDQSDFKKLNKKASQLKGGGEGPEHKKLKTFVANNPQIFGLPSSSGPGEKEHSLPSGDSLDVFFVHRKEHIGIEVKPHISDSADITRGLYQCVKYQAVLEARQAANGEPQNVRTILVLGGELPDELVPLKNVLGIEVYEKVNAHNG
ncbi:MAG: hypothetical protein GXP14_12360 [Gammaproteobacteria bacterium]|nr:hypothetical protein [Gammaproteobacteria bacterium]